jgi:hypothetical protein
MCSFHSLKIILNAESHLNGHDNGQRFLCHPSFQYAPAEKMRSRVTASDQNNVLWAGGTREFV